MKIVCKYILFFVFYFIVFHSIAQSDKTNYLVECFNNTYKENLCYYSILHTRLKSNGDTVRYHYDVNISNKLGELSFSTLINDSILEIYLYETLLTANLNKKEYELKNIHKEEIYSNAKYLFQPMVDSSFHGIIEDSVIIDKEECKNQIRNYNVKILNPGDLQELDYNFSVSEKTNEIISYNYKGLIAGIKLFARWDLLAYDVCNTESLDIDVNRVKYFDILKKFRPKCLDSATNIEKSNLPVESIHNNLPYYKLISIDNDTIQIASDSAKIYLVDYWYRACPPCIKAIPTLKELHAEFGDKQLKIISINYIDNSLVLIKKFVHDNDLNTTVYTSTVEKGKEFAGVVQYPTFVIYNSDFRVIRVLNGFTPNLMQEIKEIINDNK